MKSYAKLSLFIIRKTICLRKEKEQKSVTSSKKSENSVYNEIKNDYEQSVFQDPEKFLRKKQLEKMRLNWL